MVINSKQNCLIIFKYIFKNFVRYIFNYRSYPKLNSSRQIYLKLHDWNINVHDGLYEIYTKEEPLMKYKPNFTLFVLRALRLIVNFSERFAHLAFCISPYDLNYVCHQLLSRTCKSNKPWYINTVTWNIEHPQFVFP